MIFIYVYHFVKFRHVTLLLFLNKQNPKSIVAPVLDVIDYQTLEYKASSNVLRGGIPIFLFSKNISPLFCRFILSESMFLLRKILIPNLKNSHLYIEN